MQLLSAAAGGAVIARLKASMGSCKKVYTRAADTKPDIAAELSGINDPDAAGRCSPRASPCRYALLDVVEDHAEAEARFLAWLTGDVNVRAAELAEAMIARAARQCRCLWSGTTCLGGREEGPGSAPSVAVGRN